MAAQVTKTTMIGELLQIDENIAPILLNIGMHCLGCPSSQMETIEEAAMVHGIEPDALVKEINDFLAKSDKQQIRTKAIFRLERWLFLIMDSYAVKVQLKPVRHYFLK